MSETNDTIDIAAYLRELGERVRSLRARRGMTRKDLSRHSDISERYLAQLENGAANPSVELLWRIVHAMGISFDELVSDRSIQPMSHAPLLDLLRTLTAEEQNAAYGMLVRHFAPQPPQSLKGVALIGLRGAGKSTLGRAMGEACGVPFLRLGDLVEQLAGMELSEIFSLGGQKTYRRLEREAVQYVIDTHERAIVEAGGSLVSESETFDLLRASFFTVWVRTSPEEHMNRVIQQGDLRPMRGNDEAMDDLRRILAEREPFYGTAGYALDTSQRTPEDCLQELTAVCRPYLEVQPVS